MDPVELVAVVMTLVGIVLTIKEKISCWPVAIPAGILTVIFRSRATRPLPRQILYVSCDPATLARDLARLPSYRIAGLAAFDARPHYPRYQRKRQPNCQRLD